MSAHEIEIILTRQLADCLSIPMFLIDPKGSLLFYNEPAEKLLGRRFEETGSMPVEEWSTMFKPVDQEGNPIPPEGLPLVKTLTTSEPAYGSFWIESLNENRFYVTVTSMPIIGRSGHYLGAIAIFWEDKPSS